MIYTVRLMIRPLEMGDVTGMLGYMSDPEVLRYEQLEPFDRKGLHAFVREIVPSKRFFAVLIRETAELVGHLYFGPTGPESFKEWMIGYIFHPMHQNHGYCTEAAKALIDFGFGNWGCHRVVARCNPDNIPSWRVMEKIGLKREGLMKKRVCFKYDENGDPIWWDEVVYGIVVDDWK